MTGPALQQGSAALPAPDPDPAPAEGEHVDGLSWIGVSVGETGDASNRLSKFFIAGSIRRCCAEPGFGVPRQR